MKIAIVAPSPVPYTIGGAEKFCWGLYQAINKYSKHQAELIKLPSPETSFFELMESYERFSNMDLSHFDLLISSKYPAWMVAHHNHHCYMVHRLRGVYDTYHFTGMPIELEDTHPQLSSLLNLLNNSQCKRSELSQFWQEWHRLKKLVNEGGLSAEEFTFPGPLSRKVIHFLDNIALSSQAIKRFSAISHNLLTRKSYFPHHAQVDVIHPPSDVEHFIYEDIKRQKTIFTMSRLDGPKRIEMLIRAFMQTRIEIDFRIAGSGPEEQKLKKLAENDKRIIFLGRITDKQAIEEYAQALFVPFIPYDEDYGLITIEAMKSRKAVLTTIDAGGVNEFVEHGVSGYSVDANPETLAKAITKMCNEPDLTYQMGMNAEQKVAHVNWKQVVKQLIKNGDGKQHEHIEKLTGNQHSLARPKKNIVVVLTFSVYPPRGGGQSRAYNIYREVARQHNVTLVVLLDQEKAKQEQQQNIAYQELLIAPNMREIRVAKSRPQLMYEHELHKQLGTPVEDIACIDGYEMTPVFSSVLKSVSQNADLLISCHPFLFYAIREVWNGPLWYEAQDVEVDIKRAILGDSNVAKEWITKTQQVEKSCSVYASKIFTCSEKDAERIGQLYSQAKEKLMVIANGVDMRLSEDEYEIQKKIGMSENSVESEKNSFVVLFMGSWHGPNVEAMEHVKSLALACPQAVFLLMGSVCEHPQCNDLPENVASLGMVSETEKNLYLRYADLALNPILSGSGTNLKMLDYTAKSLPVLTTPFGLRGLTFIPEQEVLCAEINDFAQIINNFAQLNYSKQLKEMVFKAFERTQKEYSWQVIAKDLLMQLEF